MSAGRRRPADADARWSEACEWHDAAHETEIEAELASYIDPPEREDDPGEDDLVFDDAWAAAAQRMDTPDMDDVEDSQ